MRLLTFLTSLTVLWYSSIIPRFIPAIFTVTGDTTGKPACPLTPFSCTANLASVLYDSTDIDSVIRSYRNVDTLLPNFHDVSYQAGQINCTIPMNTCTQDTTRMKYKVYNPNPAPVFYQRCGKLPLILLIHGGGFRDCSSGYDSLELRHLCRSFAQRGYIAVSMEYRTGVLTASDTNALKYSVQQMLGIWRAAQDARGCLRSIIRREREGTEPYRIDTSRIFIGGSSAGSVTAMNVAFYNKGTLLAAAFPTGINSNGVLGTISQKYYYGSDTISYTIKGVLNMWGGVLIPPNYLANPENFFFISGNNMPPIISFCGAKDPLFNFQHQALKYVPSNALPSVPKFYDTTSYCLNSSSVFSITPANPGPDGWILGSQDIYEMFRRKGVPTEFYLDCDMAHGISGKSDFGLVNHSEPDLQNYFAARAATFFQAVINNKATQLGTTKFVGRENYRNTCDTTSNNDGCPSDADSVNQVCPQQP